VPRVLHVGDLFWRPSNQLGVSNNDLAPPGGGDAGRAAVAAGAPGIFDAAPPLRGGRALRRARRRGRIAWPARCRLAPLSAVLVEPEVERQIFNDSDAEALWLVAGASEAPDVA
jgi:hypothetical protein